MQSRKLIQATLVAAMVAAPALAFAQADPGANAPKTRAEVKAELQQLEQAGYNPFSGDEVSYPQDIQAAEARVAQQRAMAQTTTPAADTSGYGTAPAGKVQTGQPAMPSPSN
ncbi:DUF4148 domain-containing protein [Paraburkholderia adhaesiva]|uniref:DUF4148 domain-containing protein n=1 Tax=Paraburkholderia adhaesiva TaxID=2883244 RepID=UPI001F39022D|nr:DUF4148 domain-containing protein [Paraburkholderia adhaesiva]